MVGAHHFSLALASLAVSAIKNLLCQELTWRLKVDCQLVLLTYLFKSKSRILTPQYDGHDEIMFLVFIFFFQAILNFLFALLPFFISLFYLFLYITWKFQKLFLNHVFPSTSKLISLLLSIICLLSTWYLLLMG